MDMLHLVPAALLCTLGFWLLWPVIVDPIARRKRVERARNLGATDRLADSLFENWSDHVGIEAADSSRRG